MTSRGWTRGWIRSPTAQVSETYATKAFQNTTRRVLEGAVVVVDSNGERLVAADSAQPRSSCHMAIGAAGLCGEVIVHLAPGPVDHGHWGRPARPKTNNTNNRPAIHNDIRSGVLGAPVRCLLSDLHHLCPVRQFSSNSFTLSGCHLRHGYELGNRAINALPQCSRFIPSWSTYNLKLSCNGRH